METNYSKHAAVWDWDDFDNSENYDFWCKLSDKYGKRVLSAMGAIGQAGAYMAKKGYSVTVLDYTEEMIFEGEKRFGDISSLDFVQADICEFELPENHYDFCFIATADLHVLPSLETVKMALKNINKHLRLGGGLGLELWYPSKTSNNSPMRRFDPRVPKKDGSLIWKEGEANYDATAKKQEIHQIIYIKTGNIIESFDHYVSLQLYDRNVLFDAFKECGFETVGEYCSHNFSTSNNLNENCFVELKKETNPAV